MYGRGGGDFSDMRDAFVSHLLGVFVERVEKQEDIMYRVSIMINSIEKLINGNLYYSKEQIRARLAALTEGNVVRAILVIAGDEYAMLYFIHCANKLSYQLMRPSPRVIRTQQLFNDLRIAWRAACGYQKYNWENILMLNSSLILQQVPVIKDKSEGMKRFMGKLRAMITRNNEEGEG